jgi:hypothetical protein
MRLRDTSWIAAFFATTLTTCSVALAGGRVPQPATTTLAERAAAAALRARVPSLLDRLGFSAEALAAVGYQSAEVQAIMARVSEECNDSFFTDLKAADQSCRQAESARNRAAETVRGGGGQSASPDLATQEAALVAARSARDQLLARAWAAASRDQDSQKLAKLQVIRENRRPGLPVEYCLRNRTDQDWGKLRDALSLRNQSATAEGEGLIAFLAQVDQESEVVSAKQGLQANLAAIRAILKGT